MIIAIDFDGTIVKERWPKIGALRWGARWCLKWLKDRGHILILNTCREKQLLTNALEKLLYYDLRFDEVNENSRERIQKFGGDCRKISADWYIDDRAGFLGWWSIPIIITWLEWQEQIKAWCSKWKRSTSNGTSINAER